MSSLRSIVIASPDEAARQIDNGAALVEVDLLAQQGDLIVEDPALEAPLATVASEFLFEPDDFVPPVVANSVDEVREDVALHLVEAKAYTSGMVALHYEVRK